MNLEGEVPVDYRGVANHGREWLERSYVPVLTGPGFVGALALAVLVLNATVILLPFGKVHLVLCAGAVLGSVAAATPLSAADDRGAIVPVAASGLLLLVYSAWIAVDFGATGTFHRHLVLSMVSLLFAAAWHERRCRYAWWTVIPTSDAWNEEALSAYAEFLPLRASGPYAKTIARELFRTAADMALKPREPSQKQLNSIRRYVEILREGLGGYPDFGDASPTPASFLVLIFESSCRLLRRRHLAELDSCCDAVGLFLALSVDWPSGDLRMLSGAKLTNTLRNVNRVG